MRRGASVAEHGRIRLEVVLARDGWLERAVVQEQSRFVLAGDRAVFKLLDPLVVDLAALSEFLELEKAAAVCLHQDE